MKQSAEEALLVHLSLGRPAQKHVPAGINLDAPRTRARLAPIAGIRRERPAVLYAHPPCARGSRGSAVRTADPAEPVGPRSLLSPLPGIQTSRVGGVAGTQHLCLHLPPPRAPSGRMLAGAEQWRPECGSATEAAAHAQQLLSANSLTTPAHGIRVSAQKSTHLYSRSRPVRGARARSRGDAGPTGGKQGPRRRPLARYLALCRCRNLMR